MESQHANGIDLQRLERIRNQGKKHTRMRNFGRAAAEEITHLLEDAIDYHQIQLNMHQYGRRERLGMNRHSMRTQIDERETNPRERVCGGEMNQRAACDLMCKIKISTTVSPLIGMWDHLVS